MAIAEASWYSAGIAIILASVYALRLTRIQNFLSKIFLALGAWLENTAKEEFEYQVPLATSKEKLTASKYTSAWWTDEKQFQLERRAIFSKTWQYVTHASRFQKPGDYRTFEIAGFSFIVILGKDKQLRAFHNVCRHRAYAVTKKESGSSTVLGCRYHGWSYDTKGKLIKAPEFENVAGFDKALNGLWELKAAVWQGMVFVNFEAGNGEPKLDLAEYEGIMKRWKIGELKWAHEWKTEANFNWKLAAGTLFLNIDSEKTSYLASVLPRIFRSQEKSLTLFHTTRMRRLTSGRLLSIKFLPLTTANTLIECNIYGRSSRHTKATQLEVEVTKKEVEAEIKRLEIQQKELLSNNSLYLSSENPSEFRDLDLSFNQDELAQILEHHRDAERRVGKKIHPAARKQSFTKEGKADDDFCKELEMGSNSRDAVCGANAKGSLEW